MKKIHKTFLVIVFLFYCVNLFAQAASVTWPLTSNQNPNTPLGNIQASAESIGSGSGQYILSIFNPYVSNGQRLWTGNQGTGWIAGLPDYTRFIQFNVSPTSGNNFTVQNLSFDYSDNPLSTDFNIIKAEVWYSLDDWDSKTQLNTSPLNYLNTSVQTFIKNVSIQVLNGKTFSLRIFPYTLNGGLAMTPSFATHRNVIIEGSTSPVVTTGSICGVKFNDLNGNGRKDSGELGLSGWTITLLGGVIPLTATTGADGNYCFNNLPAGTYTLSETQQNGWQQTSPLNPNTHTVVLTAGQNVLNVDFGNKQTLGKICGIKFNDLNGNGRKDSGELGLSGWTITLLGGVIPLTATTGADGNYCFNNLPAGTYTLSETQQNGWQQTSPLNPNSHTVVLTAGQNVINVDFGNKQLLGSICGKKFNDLNGNRQNDNEPGLSGWIIELKYNGPNGVVTLKDTTDSEGNYCFNNLPWNTYTLTEVNKNGWTQTAPAAPGSYTITINSEINLIGYDFGNKEVLNPNCVDFENNSLSGWQANNISTSILLSGNNHYVQTTDQAGVSTFYTTSKPFTGNWTSLFSNGCGSLCFDVSFIYGGNVYNGVTPPQTLNPYIAIEGAGFKASFVINQTISVGSGWHSYCAPLSFLNPDGSLPSNSSGYWVMTQGAAIDWNTLLTNVTKVRLLADPTSFQGEKIGYDNICLKNTGDCNPPIKLGSICGIKILDKNSNGIKDSNEDGIANWTIYLFNGTTTLSTVTDANGNYCFNDLPTGTYIVSEEQKDGWKQVFPIAPGTHTISLNGQNVSNVNFSNVEDITIRLGSICGFKFNDLNGNGKQDDGELGLPNWTFQLTGAANLTVTTDHLGNFCFYNLKPGDYTIKEVIQDGWEPTTPNASGSYSVNLQNGQNLFDIKFGNKEKLGSICGVKYNDINGNGKRDDGEPGLPGWKIGLSSYLNNNTGQSGLGLNLIEIATVTTDNNGEYCFNNIKPGNYTITEYYQSGWTQTEPSNFVYQITLMPGQKLEKLNFGNKVDLTARLGSICGIKFNDKNGNGKQDAGENGIPDWQINLGGLMDLSVYTNKEGKFCFDNLPPGEYKVGETMRNGWRQIVPSTNYYIIQLASGQNITDLMFGNKEDDRVQLGSICGTKFNDRNRDGRQSSGELGIKGWNIYLEGPMNLTAVTDDNGNFCFYGLIPGTYTVREENRTGWRQTKPSSVTYTLEVSNGVNFTGIDFGNIEDPTVKLGTICGVKYNDLNGNGKQDSGEPGIPNWTIELNGAMKLTVTTDARGNFCFTNLIHGSYIVSEKYKDGWTQTSPSSGYFSVELSEDKNPDDLSFGNRKDETVKLGSICGMKFNDKDGNGRKDPGESGIPNWQINIGGPVDRSIKTDKNGEFCFADLPPGKYIIKEELQTNWVQTSPASPGFYSITLSSGEQKTNIIFGNKFVPKVGCVVPPSGMTAWWSLDFSARDQRVDLAGYNNYGTMLNNPLQVAGKVMGALQFDGVDDYVEVADHSELNFGTGNFSFDAWIKTNAKTGVEVLVDKRKGYNLGYSFFLNDGYLSVQLADGSGFFGYTNYASPVFVADGNWHHIAVTVTRSNNQGILFYLDGVPTQFGNPTTHQSTLNNTDNLRIGKNSAAGNIDPIGTFNGILDEIELFNRVLTPAEVLSIYNAGSAGKCKPISQGGSASGSVWHDLNNNGVKDPGEVSLTQWSVLLNGASVVQTETDNNGNFHFTDLKPGTYSVSTVALNGWSVIKPSKGSITFDLAQDLSIDKLEFGLINDPCLSGNKNWHSLGSGVNGTVIALAVLGNDLYVGGTFSAAGGLTGTSYIAKWNGSSWSTVGGGVNGPVNTFLVVGSDLYVGGSFTSAGTTSASNIAKWNGTSWSALGSGTNGYVSALLTMGNDLYVGGRYTSAGNVNAKCIAKWNISTQTWSAVGSGVNPNASGVQALASIGTDLYVGGAFYLGTGGANNPRNIVKWNTITSNWSSLGTSLNDEVESLAVLNGELYAGGQFDNNSLNHISKWDGTNWTTLGNGTTGNIAGFSNKLLALGSELYVGGQFAFAGTIPAKAVARWDGTNWFALGNGVSSIPTYYGSSSYSVFALANKGSDIYAGGSFNIAGNSSANNIAKYSCSSSTATSVYDDESKIIPSDFNLSQNYPNPFNPTSIIRYYIPKTSYVKIIVYDVLGREVRTLINEEKQAGKYEVVFDGAGLASGIYIYSIRTSEYFMSKKMLMVK